MIILSDRFDVVPGKMDEALAWADKIWMASKEVGFVGGKRWMFRSISSAQRFSFATQFASLAEYEEEIKKVSKPAIQALVKELAIGGGLVRTERGFMRTLKEE